MFFLIVAVAIDSQSEYLSPEDFSKNTLRDALLKLFLRRIFKEGKRFMGGPNWRLENYCEWNGICCYGDGVTEVRYTAVRYGNFEISALPYMTEGIFIEKCCQTSRLNTRGLPRNLMILSLFDNAFHGSLDLRTLPPKLEEANFSKNRLTGPIALIDLPRSMRKLTMSDNPIHQPRVWYDDLPDNLVLVVFPEFEFGRGIEELRAVHQEYATDEKGIFQGVGKVH